MSDWTKKILVTAGSTVVPIDKVRVISNIFKGRTGTAIASRCQHLGHRVTLVTSNDLLPHLASVCIKYRTYDELAEIMAKEISTGSYDIVIHSAAVSDYYVTRTCTLDIEALQKLMYCFEGFRDEYVKGNVGEAQHWYEPLCDAADALGLHPVQVITNDAKISSKHEQLFLALAQTRKLVDRIRTEWNFTGTLVKFKLEVGLTDQELLKIAYQSLQTSSADYIVANCLEWAKERAFIVAKNGHYLSTSRGALPEALHRVLLQFPKTLARLHECKL